VPSAKADFMKRVVRMIVESQVKYASPPEAKRTLRRLTRLGLSREQALDRIVSAVRPEVWRVIQGGAFDGKRYRALLEQVD